MKLRATIISLIVLNIIIRPFIMIGVFGIEAEVAYSIYFTGDIVCWTLAGLILMFIGTKPANIILSIPFITLMVFNLIDVIFYSAGSFQANDIVSIVVTILSGMFTYFICRYKKLAFTFSGFKVFNAVILLAILIFNPIQRNYPDDNVFYIGDAANWFVFSIVCLVYLLADMNIKGAIVASVLFASTATNLFGETIGNYTQWLNEAIVVFIASLAAIHYYRYETIKTAHARTMGNLHAIAQMFIMLFNGRVINLFNNVRDAYRYGYEIGEKEYQDKLLRKSA